MVEVLDKLSNTDMCSVGDASERLNGGKDRIRASRALLQRNSLIYCVYIFLIAIYALIYSVYIFLSPFSLLYIRDRGPTYCVDIFNMHLPDRTLCVDIYQSRVLLATTSFVDILCIRISDRTYTL